jgi:predicted nucleotide-binding protein
MKPRVKAILKSLGLTPIVYNYPPPAVGGPVLTYNMIDQITDNDSDFRLEKDRVFDVLDQAIGALKAGLPRTSLPTNSKKRKELFIVHGHDEAAKEAVSRFVEKLGLKALVLHEQPNRGRTIIEKFEDYSNVEMAIVIITADDVGAERDSATKLSELKPRARQDVIFELGFFSGKLGRSRVCVLYKEGVELPSDYHGVVYVPLDSSGAWRLKLAGEIRSAGIDVDMNKAI